MIDGKALIGKEISGCEILSKVAEGGMGAVFKARHKALNRIVCVKILSPALANDKKAVSLFMTEARAIAELDHPNIVNVYNLGKEKGYYFIVMSFIEGHTLSALLKKEKKLPIGIVLDLFDGILKGLSVAHEKGIIHRDIKPSNILITPEGKPKIVDFGIAKKVDKETGSTKATELAGTAYFISPEQALGKDIDARADLYSIGASMYYVLTGHFPYNGKNTIEIIQKHINDPIPDPINLRPDMPGWLALAIQKLMSKKPEDRFQTAQETATYLSKMRADEQLRVKLLHGRAAIDLGAEKALVINQPDKKISSSTVKNLRAEDVYRASVAKQTQPGAEVTSSNLPTLDTLGEAEQTLPTQTQKYPVEDPTEQKIVLEMPKQQPTATIEDLKREALVKKVLSGLLWTPVCIAFAVLVAYVFFSLGKICSVYVKETAGFITNLIAPFKAGTIASGQLLYTAFALITLGSIFALAKIKVFAKNVLVLLALAMVAYLAGLYTPEVAFGSLSGLIASNIFLPEYYLAYLVVAIAATISFCWRVNRSWSEKIMGSSLIILTAVLTCCATELSIPPNISSVLTKLLFAGGMLFTLLTIYYLCSSSDSIIAPTFCLLVALFCFWSYSVSGLTRNIQTTVTTLAAEIPMEKPADRQNAAQQEKILGIQRATLFSSFASDKAINYKTEQEKNEFLDKAIAKVTGDLLPDTDRPRFIEFMKNYYLYGPNKTKMMIWDYAINYPLIHFNSNAQTNGAYSLLLVLLFILVGINCIDSILFRDNL